MGAEEWRTGFWWTDLIERDHLPSKEIPFIFAISILVRETRVQVKHGVISSEI